MWPSSYPALDFERGNGRSTFGASGRLALQTCSSSNKGCSSSMTSSSNRVEDARVEEEDVGFDIVDHRDQRLLTTVRSRPSSTFAEIRSTLLVTKLNGKDFDFISRSGRRILSHEEHDLPVPKSHRRIKIAMKDRCLPTVLSDAKRVVHDLLCRLSIIVGPSFAKDLAQYCSKGLDFNVQQVSVERVEERIRAFISAQDYSASKRKECLAVLRNARLSEWHGDQIESQLLVQSTRPKVSASTTMTNQVVKAIVSAHESGVEFTVHGSDLTPKEKTLSKIGSAVRFFNGEEVVLSKYDLSGIIQRTIPREGKYVVHAKVDGKKLLEELDVTSGDTGKVSIADFSKRFEFIDIIRETRPADLREAMRPFEDMASNKLIVRSFLRHCFPQTENPAVESILSKLRQHYYLRSFGGIKLKNGFQRCDPRQSGKISVSEFRSCLEECGLSVTRKEMNELLDHLDPLCTNLINYTSLLGSLEKGCGQWKDARELASEFRFLVQERFRKDDGKKVDLDKAFESLDKDKDKFVSARDLKEAFVKEPFEQFSALHQSEIVRLLESSKHTEHLEPDGLLAQPKPLAAVVGLSLESFKKFIDELEETNLEELKQKVVSLMLSHYLDNAGSKQSFRDIYDNYFDSDSQGELNTTMFVRGIHCLCELRLTHAQAEFIVNSMKRFNGRTTFQSFLEMLCPCTSDDVRLHVRSVVSNAWKTFPSRMEEALKEVSGNENGCSEAEFVKHLQAIGVDLSDEHLTLLFSELKSNRGVVEREKFLNFLKKREPKDTETTEHRMSFELKKESKHPASGNTSSVDPAGTRDQQSNRLLAKRQVQSYFQSSPLGSM